MVPECSRGKYPISYKRQPKVAHSSSVYKQTVVVVWEDILQLLRVSLNRLHNIPPPQLELM